MQLGDLSPADDAAAAPGSRTVRIGYVSLMDTLQTLNPLVMTWGTEYVMIYSCYSELLTRDVNQNVIGDLATSWTSSPDGLTWHFKMVNNARFYDRMRPAEVHPVTAYDVKYSYELVQSSTNNIMQFYFPILPGQTQRLMESFTVINDYEFEIKLRGQYAPFLNALTSIPILPQYIWSQFLWNWANFKTSGGGTYYPPIVGSGAYFYVLDNIPNTGAVTLQESPTWFAREEYGYDVKPSTLLFRDETEPTAQSNFNADVNDIWISPTGDQYAALVDDAYTDKFHSSQGYVWEFNMNQLTLADRDLYSVGGAGDYNNQLLLDPTVKLALQMTIDKSVIANEVLAGLATPSDSLVPAVSPWHYTYGSVPGETVIPFDPAGARDILNAAGWSYTTGGVLNTEATPLCKVGGSDPLIFRYITPDTSSKYHDASVLIDAWAAQAGIQLDYTGASTSSYMNGAWAAADYDTWLWNWWFTPTSDPSADVLQVLATEAIGGWSDVYWSNATFDALYYESLTTMDFAGRKAVLDEMQRMAYEDSGCYPVVSVDNLYAIQTVAAGAGDQWTNWGNWNNYYPLCGDSGYWWLWMQLYPLDNPAPQITGFTTYYETNTTTPVNLGGSVVGEASVNFRWNFGDGTKSSWAPWTTGATTSHLYSTDGYYTAYFQVVESAGSDAFMSFQKATIKVRDDSNTAPRSLGISVWPGDPDAGTAVYFNGSAIDDQSDPMTFSWNFGDNQTAVGQSVTHQFTTGMPSYTVTMYVDDGRIGQLPRPVSTTALVSVAPNQAPTISVQAEPAVTKSTPWTFHITASDPNTRDQLKYTWDWGDAEPDSVTATQTAVHTYKFTGDYTLRVYADDQTGLLGHNVSGTALVHVQQAVGNHVPQISVFTVSNDAPLSGQIVTFTGTGLDEDLGDLLTFTWTFGDGETATSVQSIQNETLTMTHAYMVDGVYTAYLTVYDGQLSKLSSGIDMIVDPATATINLAAGWNMMSLPLINTGEMASTLGLGFGDLVVGWNSVTQSYDRTYIVGLSPPSANFAIENGLGYFVYVGMARPVALVGDVPSFLVTQDVNIPTAGGWALIGITSTATTWRASHIPAMYSVSGSIDLVAWYNPVTHSYKSYIPGIPITDYAMSPGMAVWVHAWTSGTLTYSP